MNIVNFVKELANNKSKETIKKTIEEYIKYSTGFTNVNFDNLCTAMLCTGLSISREQDVPENIFKTHCDLRVVIKNSFAVFEDYTDLPNIQRTLRNAAFQVKDSLSENELDDVLREIYKSYSNDDSEHMIKVLMDLTPYVEWEYCKGSDAYEYTYTDPIVDQVVNAIVKVQ